ncbi:MAG: OPT/YSL family transporter, partial [Pirellulales bacterium]
LGFEGMSAMVATLGVASVVCCAACTSGDVCNDLKTGYLVGASPRSQQIMQMIGVGVACLVMAPVLNALHIGSLKAAEHDYQRRLATYERELAAGKEVAPPIAIKGGIGGDEMSAPQATLMKSLVQGVFGSGNLPWRMIALGVVIGGVILAADGLRRLLGLPVPLYLMPIAVGIYLPLRLSVSIFVGGLLHFFIMKMAATPERRRHAAKRAVLIASGLIAGESLLGVAGGILAYYGVHGLNLTEGAPAAAMQLVALAASQWTALIAIGLLCGGVAYWTVRPARED